MDMIPDGPQSHNLPGLVKLLAAAIHMEIKKEISIKDLMHGTATIFKTPEKSLQQAVKGMKYESNTQKNQHELVQCDKEESSSSDVDSSDDDGGASVLANIKPLKKPKKSK